MFHAVEEEIITKAAEKQNPEFTVFLWGGGLYADNIPGARSMTMSPGGVLFVGTRKEGKIYPVVDGDGDDRAGAIYQITYVQ